QPGARQAHDPPAGGGLKAGVGDEEGPPVEELHYKVGRAIKGEGVKLMCGRFSQRSPSKKIAEKFQVEGVPPLLERYNVAPSQPVLGIREAGGVREAT